MAGEVIELVPIANVADVQRSIDFYDQLGMKVRHTLKDKDGKLMWAHVAHEGADLMFAAGNEAGPGKRTVLLYFYSRDLIAMRDHLLARGVKVSEITYPEYMPKGEICLEDPDGYTVLIGQAG